MPLGKPHGPADRRLVEFCGIDANRSKNRCVQIAHGDGVFDRGRSLRIRGANHASAPNAAACQCHAEACRPMVAAAGCVDVRRAAELAATNDDGPFEETSLAQIADERAEGRVENGKLTAVSSVVVRVRVPARQRHLHAAARPLQ